MVKFVVNVIILAFILTLPSGCVRYVQKKPLPDVVSLPSLSNEPKQFNLRYSFSYQGPLTFQRGVSYDIWNYKLESVEVLKETGYFANLANEDQRDLPELQTITMDARLVNNDKGFVRELIRAYVEVFCVGSFGMIPTWYTVKWTISAKLETSDKKEHVYQVEDSVTEQCWFPLIYIFAREPTVDYKRIRMNMWRNLILKMHQDGIFEQKQ